MIAEIDKMYRRPGRKRGLRSTRMTHRRTWGYRCVKDGTLFLTMDWRKGPNAYSYRGMLTDYEMGVFVLGPRALIALTWIEMRRKARGIA